MRQRGTPALHCLHMSGAHLCRVVHEHELREVVAHGRAGPVLRRGKPVAAGKRIVAELLVNRRTRTPRPTPVFPSRNAWR